MRKWWRLAGTTVVAAVVLVMAACSEEAERATEDAAQRAADAARRAGSTVVGGAESATRLKATLTGAAEVPPGDPDGAGTANVNINVTKGEVCYEVSVQKLDRPVGMHIHEGETGKNGGIVVPMSVPASGDSSTAGCANADAGLIGRMVANPGNFYVNVHTQTHPPGAIRGQLSQ